MTTDDSARNALIAIGVDPDMAVITDNANKQRGKVRDNRICICGHGMSRHKEIAGEIMCKPSRLDCPCKAPRAVLEVDDTRAFLRKTVGGGAMHALSRGLSALIMSGKSAEWIVDLKCDRCGKVDEIVTPVPVTKSGHAMSYPTGYDALLCQECREEV